MKSIKHLTKKIIINYCKNYGHKYENIENTDVSKNDTDFLFKLGLLNSLKRKEVPKKISFNLNKENTSTKNSKNPKSILKHKYENNRTNDNMLKLNSNSLVGYKSFSPDNYNYHFNSKFSTTQMNNIQQNKSNTNINQNIPRNISFFSSRNRLSDLGTNEIGKTKVNQINQINNNINYNIVINDVDMNNDSKTLLKSEENKNTNSLLKKSLKNMASINTNNYERSSSKKSYFMQNVPITIKGNSNISKNNININNLYPPENPSLNKIVTLNMPNKNNLEGNISKTNTIQMDETDEKKSENPPNTINDLSKSLLKKVKKKIKKRRKRKKLYKMLVQKITESIAKVNPNINLSSSLNNNTNSLILSSKIGEVLAMNPEFNSIIDEKPELNPNNLTQSLNPNPELNNPNLNPINRTGFPFPHEFVQFPNPQELFLIPESLEISSSDSSSENSDESSEEKNSSKINNSKNDSKLNEKNEKKKEVELSISENYNFSLNNTYENLNKLSEGNYSKDENLQKSVQK
jgi:hypothetical protein